MNVTTLIFRRHRNRVSANWKPRALTFAIVAITLLVCLYAWIPYLSLVRTQFASGYALMTGILALAALNIRKKFPGLPLGKISTWVHVHLVIGFITVGVFAWHVGTATPRNSLKWSLYGCFLFVASSGVYGLFLTRVLPPQLRALREEVVYEKIGELRHALAAEARELVLKVADSSETMVDLYRRRLMEFMERPRGLFYYLYPTKLRCHGLIAEVNGIKRYLNPAQQTIAEQLAKLLSRKDELDLHAAWQGRLKLWLFAHIGFTYALILLGFMHGFLVHAYHGGAL
jgi:hypothetical protein